MFLLIASSVNEARWSVASVDGAQPPPGCSRERAQIARLTFATPEQRGQERRRRRRRSTAFYGGPGGRRPRPLRYRAQATGLRGLSVALAAARHTRMVRSPKLQCKSGRPALGSSRPRLRTPASAAHSAHLQLDESLAVVSTAISGSAALRATIEVITSNTSTPATFNNQTRPRLDRPAIPASIF